MSEEIFSEYVALKNEQIERIKIRDSFINYVIVSVGILLSVAFGGTKTHAVIVLSIPWVALAFGWVFIMNDIKISHIGRYLSEVLVPQTSSSWDRWRVEHRNHFLENIYTGLSVQFFIFVIPAVAAMVIYPFIRVPAPLKLWEYFILTFDWISTGSLVYAFGNVTRERRGVGRPNIG